MNICVFCSSSSQVDDKLKNYAFQFGKWIAQNGHTLVYGGATGGLMDCVAEGAAACEGDIIGIIPDILVEKGRKSELPTELFLVENMAQRKEMMVEYADVCVALPGGVGTLDEIFSTMASSVVGEHDKPMYIFNPDGYWEGLEAQIERIKAEGAAYKFANIVYGFFSTLEQLEQQISQLDN